MRPAGSHGRALGPPREGPGERRDDHHLRGRAEGPGAEAAALEAGPGSPVPRPALPNRRRAVGKRAREKRESKRRCSMSGDWADAGRGERGKDPSLCLPGGGASLPAFGPVMATVHHSGYCPILSILS